MSGHHVDRGIRAGVRRLFRLPLRTPAIARADADAELESFLEERVASLVRRGMTPTEARQEALRRLGAPVDEVRDALRHSAEQREGRLRVREMIDELLQDLRFAGRQFRKAPVFTAIAVLTLALGIGANTAIFSVIDRLLLAPLPYPNGDRIVMPMQENELVQGDARAERLSVDASLVQTWQARTHTVEAISAASLSLFSLRPDGIIDTIPSVAITVNFLPMLGVQPILGRGFMPEDVRPLDQVAVAMISYALWQHAYGGRADVLGRTVPLDGRPLTIVGVTPPGLNIPLSQNPAPDIWVPTPLGNAANGGNGSLKPGPTIFAVLRPGITVDAASRELQTIAASLPDVAKGNTRRGVRAHTRVRVMRAQDFLNARETRALQVLFVAVGALLLIACANVANLLLARAWTRQREFAVRAALGAGRRRLARQVLTESVVLALGGGVLGVGVAWLTLRVIIDLRPPALAHLAGVRLEPAILLWTLGISIATGILFGSAPALVAGARRVGDVLRRETRGGSPGVASRRVRSALIVLEIAASLVLLVGAGLLVRSVAELQRMPLGFEPRGLVYTDVVIGGPRNHDRVPVVRDAILARLRALPGVTGVAIGTMPGRGYVAPGIEAETDRIGYTTRVPTFGMVFISPNYFRLARIALVAGRLPDSSTLTAAWKAGPPRLSPEVLVNRALARRIAPDGHAIGSRVREAWLPPGRSAPWSTVVGVVDDTRMPDVHGAVAALQLYTLIPPRFGDVPFVVRTAQSGDVSAPAIKHAIASVDPGIFVRPMLSGDTYLRDGLSPTRFAMALLTAFAVIALVLAAVGLYGVIAYSVTQRTREIGVRVALGAQAADVARLVVGEGIRLATVGVVLGVAGAFVATRALRGMLYGVGPADPLTFVAIALLLAGVALVASYLPARRALRVDPTEALRAE